MKSAWCALASFAAGVLVDLDHFIDYYSDRGFTIKIKDMYDSFVRMEIGKLYLVLHSYELVIALWISACALSFPGIWVAVAIGMTQHIILDQMTNPLTPLSYFITYRMRKGFDRDLLIH